MPFEHQVYVVDNRSTDGSAQMVATSYPEVRLIVAGRNGGYAYGNNTALRHILRAPCGLPGAEYVLLLNPDTVVAPSCVRHMIDFMESHPEAGIGGPKIVRPDGTLDLACRRSFPAPSVSLYRLLGLSRLFPSSPRFARYNLTYLDPDRPAEVDSVTGAFMLLRRSALEDAGLLDERFFMYGEDLDLAYRVKAKGWRVLYNPAALVVHYKGASSSKRSNRSIIEFYRAMHIFYHKHYASRQPFAVTWLINFGIASKGAVSLMRNALRPDEKKRVA